MKKFLGFILTLLLAAALAVPVFAIVEQPAVDRARDATLMDEQLVALEPYAIDQPNTALDPYAIYAIDDQYVIDQPRLADGQPGRGNVIDPYALWERDGYPENVSFAHQAGGELLVDGTVVAWWEIGVVDTDESGRQAILDLLSPDCRVTFRECKLTHARREAAYKEILALSGSDDNILDVVLGRNSEAIIVAIADGYEKEYAKEFIQQYGSFVVVTNSILADDEDSVLSAGDVQVAGGNDNGLTETAAVGGLGNSWFLPLCLLALIGFALLAFSNRLRAAVPAMQTTQGTVVTQGAKASKKDTILAVKNSEAIPSDKVYDAIRRRIEE